MFGFSRPTLPVPEDEQEWIDRSFCRLASLLGSRRLLDATVMLPTAEHFPDQYDRSETSLHRVSSRVAKAMQLDPHEIDVMLFETTYAATRSLAPFYSGSSPSTAGGLHHHNPEQKANIFINEEQLEDPIVLVATLAHEFGHVILLRPGLVNRDEPDMEPLNDLLTVFLGLGIFTANSAFRFKQFNDNQSQGWSVRRLGYLSEQSFGYALARFAFERGEVARWRTFLSTNIAAYFKRSVAWLAAQGLPKLLSESKS